MIRQNSCTLNIGGDERTLKFNMMTYEFYLDTLVELTKNKKINIDNPITQISLVIYCAVMVGDRKVIYDENNIFVEVVQGKDTKNLTFQMCKIWIETCEDERFEQVNDFALEAMGFISSVEQSQFNRQMEKIQSMGMNVSEILEKALSSKF
jgi:hypothetical protein